MTKPEIRISYGRRIARVTEAGDTIKAARQSAHLTRMTTYGSPGKLSTYLILKSGKLLTI
jgi:hypothetical protein